MEPTVPKGFIEIDTQALVKCNWNYKDNNAATLKKLVENIKRNGLNENLVVRLLATGFFEIVNGNHRYDAIQELSIKRCWVFNLGVISDAAARRIAIEGNETKFESDLMRMGSILREINSEFSIDDLVKTLPFNEKQIDKMMKLDNWPVQKDGDSGESQEDLMIVKFVFTFEQFEAFQLWKIKCGSENDVGALMQAIESVPE